MEKQTSSQGQSNYLIIFTIIIVVNITTLFIAKYFLQQPGESSIVVENISNLNKKITELADIVKLNNSEVKITDRLNVGLIKEFGNDNEFLNKIAKLKKQIIKRELESQIVKLEGEKIARNNTSSDGSYALGYKKQTASQLFEIMMINATNKKVVIRVEDNIASLGIGDNIRGFIIKEINDNQVIMKNQDGDTEVLGLSYLTNKLYDKTTNGDKNVK